MLINTVVTIVVSLRTAPPPPEVQEALEMIRSPVERLDG